MPEEIAFAALPELLGAGAAEAGLGSALAAGAFTEGAAGAGLAAGLGGAGEAALGAGLVGGAEGALGGGELAGAAGGDLLGGAGGGAAGGVGSGLAGPGAVEANAALGLGGQAATGGATAALPGGAPAGGGQFLDATVPTAALSPETASVLGISDAGAGFSLPEVGSTGTGFVPGGGDAGFAGGADGGLGGVGGGEFAADGGGLNGTEFLSQAQKKLKELGLSPATAAMLGISGVNALTTPKLPGAAKTLQDQAGPGAQQAQAVIQSGGTGSPAWQSQKASIDATIDQQIQEQTQAIMQNAVNSGQGPDSQVTVQQVNKLKTQLETQRQTLYAQAQGQNVQAALSSLGIQDQALSQVANAQFAGSNEAKASAAATAQNALMLQALSRQTAQPASA